MHAVISKCLRQLKMKICLMLQGRKPESQQLLGIKPKPPWLEPPVLYCCTVTTMIFDMYHTGGGSEGFSCTPG